jgi:hypothetical protein
MKDMITLAIATISLLAVAAGLKFGAEDRPGFNERRPLA